MLYSRTYIALVLGVTRVHCGAPRRNRCVALPCWSHEVASQTPAPRPDGKMGMTRGTSFLQPALPGTPPQQPCPCSPHALQTMPNARSSRHAHAHASLVAVFTLACANAMPVGTAPIMRVSAAMHGQLDDDCMLQTYRSHSTAATHMEARVLASHCNAEAPTHGIQAPAHKQSTRACVNRRPCSL